MTGPLAPLFAQVREARRGIAASLIAVKGHLDMPYPDDPRWTPWTRFIERALLRLDESAAALSSIERHVQEMEKALTKIVGLRMPDGFGPGSALMEAKAIARAALPAREKEEETNG